MSISSSETLSIGKVTGVSLGATMFSVRATNGIDLWAAGVVAVSTITTGVAVRARSSVRAGHAPHLLPVLVGSEGAGQAASSQRGHDTEEYSKRHHLVFLLLS